MFLESLTYDICMYFVSGMCMWECTELDIKQYLIFLSSKGLFELLSKKITVKFEILRYINVLYTFN